ncbi:MAG: dihydroneopterin aldolase [Bacteroidetes bacterium]|nr:MAG: dihydroneopterin aldolase [Bacteroidota bacterium]
MLVELVDLAFYAYHGLYEAERINGGEFRVDVAIETANKAVYHTIKDVVNYEDVYRIVKAEMDIPRDFIEEVARTIKHNLLATFTDAENITVTLTKCAPPIEGMKGSAKVTV